MTASHGREVLGVAELNARIAGVVEAQLGGEVWVAGEIARLSERSGTRYFDLVEHRDGRTEAQLPCTILRWQRASFDRELAAVPGFTFEAGTQVLVRGRLSFYAPWGRLQLQVVGIDPAHTLGRMRLERERLLAELRGAGAHEINGRRPVPAVPLRVGLVTSRGSRAEGDVLAKLREARYRFEVVVAHSSVQGPRCEPETIAALEQLARLHRTRPLDVVLLVRGGGGPTELAGYDSPGIARAIVAAPFPVWTGIGHEADTSVADVVAHTACTTPTAAAETVIARVAAAERQLDDLARQLATTARGRVDASAATLQQHTTAMQAAVRSSLRLAATRLTAAQQAVPAAAEARTSRERSRLARVVPELTGRAVRGRLAREQQRLAAVRTALAREPVVVLERRQAQLELAEVRLTGLDPALQLARGFALIYDRDGQLVRSVAGLQVGDDLRLRLRDGELAARVSDGRGRATAAPSIQQTQLFREDHGRA